MMLHNNESKFSVKNSLFSSESYGNQKWIELKLAFKTNKSINKHAFDVCL